MNVQRDVSEESLNRSSKNSSEVGENPRNSENGQAIYRALRDARNSARSEERRQENADPNSRDFGALRNWQNVADLAEQILADVGQDIETYLWLIEAETRLSGHAGLARVAGRLAEAIKMYGTALHPQPEAADDDPFAILGGLNGIGREGTLVQPLRLVPLVPGAAYGDMNLWHLQSGIDAERVIAAIGSSPAEPMRGLHADVIQAANAVELCDRELTDLLGGDAPPFSRLLDILDDTERTLRRLAGLSDVPAVETEDTAAEPEPGKPAPISTTFASREDAFEHLLLVAAYFRKTEPHSPISDSLETLVRRGRMDFVSLLEELIPDANARQSVMTTAGIAKKPTQSEGGT